MVKTKWDKHGKHLNQCQEYNYHGGAIGIVGQGMEDPILQPGIKLCPLH